MDFISVKVLQILPQIVSSQFNSELSIPILKQFLKMVGITWKSK